MKTKKGVRIINCARGGLVDEEALRDLLIKSGHVAGAAFDVFERSRPRPTRCSASTNVVCTPHLGASTVEAQENVALQVAEQMADYLLTGAVTNALNMPSISAEERPTRRPSSTSPRSSARSRPAHRQPTSRASASSTRAQVGGTEHQGALGGADAGVLRPHAATTVNMVNAPVMAKERGIEVEEVTQRAAPMRLQLAHPALGHDEKWTRSVPGTLFGRQAAHHRDQGHRDRGRVRAAHALHHQRRQAGLHRPLGTLLGENGVNIATFHLGRDKPGGGSTASHGIEWKVSQLPLSSV
jgi:D-3-phosphoglycerate dehydrogenase